RPGGRKRGYVVWVRFGALSRVPRPQQLGRAGCFNPALVVKHEGLSIAGAGLKFVGKQPRRRQRRPWPRSSSTGDDDRWILNDRIARAGARRQGAGLSSGRRINLALAATARTTPAKGG